MSVKTAMKKLRRKTGSYLKHAIHEADDFKSPARPSNSYPPTTAAGDVAATLQLPEGTLHHVQITFLFGTDYIVGCTYGSKYAPVPRNTTPRSTGAANASFKQSSRCNKLNSWNGICVTHTFYAYLLQFWRRDSSRGTVTTIQAGQSMFRGSISGRDNRFYSPSPQRSAAPRPAPGPTHLPKWYLETFPAVNRSEREADHLPWSDESNISILQYVFMARYLT
jgi:hypothetical protein